jgi:hypothetical protein
MRATIRHDEGSEYFFREGCRLAEWSDSGEDPRFRSPARASRSAGSRAAAGRRDGPGRTGHCGSARRRSGRSRHRREGSSRHASTHRQYRLRRPAVPCAMHAAFHARVLRRMLVGRGLNSIKGHASGDNRPFFTAHISPVTAATPRNGNGNGSRALQGPQVSLSGLPRRAAL